MNWENPPAVLNVFCEERPCRWLRRATKIIFVGASIVGIGLVSIAGIRNTNGMILSIGGLTILGGIIAFFILDMAFIFFHKRHRSSS